MNWKKLLFWRKPKPTHRRCACKCGKIITVKKNGDFYSHACQVPGQAVIENIKTLPTISEMSGSIPGIITTEDLLKEE
jgi:hypothetical protein